MQSLKKSKQQIDIKEYYSVNIKSLWAGLKQEHASLWFLCIYFLFEYVRPQTLYPAFDVLPWAFLFLLLALVAAFRDKTAVWVTNPLNKLFISFCLIVVLSGVFSYYPDFAWENRNIMLTWVIVYFLVITVVNTERRLILFLLAYLLFSLKMGQHGTIDWIRRGFSFASYGLIGSPGWFRNSGEFSIQMLIFGSLAVAYVVSFRQYWSKVKKWILFAMASTGYLSVVGASSRGSQLALAVIIAWGLLKIKGGFKFLLLTLAIVFALYHLLPEQQIIRFEDSGKDDTSLQRLAYWKIGVKIAEEHPVIGIGYKNWMPYVTKLYPDGVGPMHKIEVPHSIYVLAAVELGYTGFAFFILMILMAFYINVRTRRTIKETDNFYINYLSYGLDAGLIGYLIAGAFVTVLYYPFFWVQIAMIVMLNNIANKMALKYASSVNQFPANNS